MLAFWKLFSVKLMKKFDIQYVKVQLEDLIESPRKYAEQMCKVLELNCDENYIQVWHFCPELS